MENLQPDPQILVDIVQTKMPYGKYKNTMIADLPVYYLEWMSGKGFPQGKLGMLLSTTFEIKTNGLGNILTMIKNTLKEGRRL